MSVFCAAIDASKNTEGPVGFAVRLGRDKAEALSATGAALAVSANIGCISQLRVQPGALPVLHLAELLDWATGGERPPAGPGEPSC